MKDKARISTDEARHYTYKVNYNSTCLRLPYLILLFQYIFPNLTCNRKGINLSNPTGIGFYNHQEFFTRCRSNNVHTPREKETTDY